MCVEGWEGCGTRLTNIQTYKQDAKRKENRIKDEIIDQEREIKQDKWK